ncbi:hypothetical protein ACLI4Z_10000 [Natrialbaceae archaeon A-arb3/5]
MGSQESSLGARLRQPEYTGENRCLPCTIVNLAIAAVIAALAAVVVPAAGLAVFAVSVLAIYFRGYLVPGTPTLTKRYAPEWFLAAFDKQPEPTGTALEPDAIDDAADGDEATVAESEADEEPAPIEHVDPERQFVTHGVVAPCGEQPESTPEQEDDLCLSPDIQSAWRAAMDGLRDGDREDQLARDLGMEPASMTISEMGGGIRARAERRLVGRWESDAALLADLAGSRVLAEHLPDWDRFTPQQQSQLANGLRAFVEQCPDCGGTIELDEETVESCCRSHEVFAITCNDCEARILEVSQ